MSPIAPPLRVGAPKVPPGVGLRPLASSFNSLVDTSWWTHLAVFITSVALRAPYPNPFWSTFGLLIQPRSFLWISLIILIYNKVVLGIRLVTCCETFHTSQISASVPNPTAIIMINIWPFGAIFGCYGTLSDDRDSA